MSCPHQYSWRRNTTPESPDTIVSLPTHPHPIPFLDYEPLPDRHSRACSPGSSDIPPCSLACLEHPALPCITHQAVDSHPNSTLWPRLSQQARRQANRLTACLLPPFTSHHSPSWLSESGEHSFSLVNCLLTSCLLQACRDPVNDCGSFYRHLWAL